jgi:hypothetical protein
VLEDADLIEEFTDDDGNPALRLAARSAQIGEPW